MVNIGGGYDADPTKTATLHAIHVARVVEVLLLGLDFIFLLTSLLFHASALIQLSLVIILVFALFGRGWAMS